MTDEHAHDDPTVAGWRAAYRGSMIGASPACPSDDRLAALACGDVSEDDRRRIADHVTTCRACADTYRLLLELHQEAGRASHAAPPWRWKSAGIAAAAILATAALLVFWQVRASRSGPSSFEDEVRGPIASVQPPHRAALSTPPEEFIWPAQTGATAYRLRLYDSGGDPVWEPPPVNDTRLRLSAETAGSLQSGRAYFWVVDVDGPVARARLGPFEFRLAAAR